MCLTVIKEDNNFTSPLKTFPTLLQSYSITTPVKHHIETSGWPTHAQVLCLVPEHYKLAKAECESLMPAVIIQPSFSDWSSALHIVEKKNGEISPCGDYHTLNNLTNMEQAQTSSPKLTW